MKDFVKKVIIFFLPLLILLIIGIIYLPQNNNDYLIKKHYLDEHSNDIETLILGSSHTYYDINPEFLSSKSFNAAYVSQTIDIDAAILFKYTHNWKHLKTIIIPIDYFTLFEQLGTSMESWRLKKYANYWGIEQKAMQSGCWHQIDVMFDIYKDRFRQIITKQCDSVTCSSLGWGNIYKAAYKTDLVKDGKIAAERHLLSDSTCFSNNCKLLNEIINFAKANNSRILFLTTPAYKTYTSLLNSVQLNKTISTIKTIVASEDNCIYINYLTDRDFLETDFHDSDHLNEIGAKKFSNKIDAVLTKPDLKPIFLNYK